MKKITYLLFAILLGFAACKKNIDDSIITDKPNPTNTETQSSIAIQVRDVNNQALAGVKVKIGDQTFLSDAEGNVSFKDLVVGNDGTGVIGEKAGYFPGFQRVFKKDTKASLIMSPTANCVEFDNSAGKEINQFTDIVDKFSIPTDAFENMDGSTYSGKVKFCYLNVPNTDTLNNLVTKNFDVSLATGKPVQTDFGYLIVKASTPQETPLRIKTSKKIKCSMFMPLFTLGNFYPQTAPAMFLDVENENTWIQSSIATSSDFSYEFDLNKVNTIWTINSPLITVRVKAKVVDKDNFPIKKGSFIFKNTIKNTESYGNIHSDGKFLALVVANENLSMSYYDCDEEKSTAIPVIYNTNTDLGTIIVKEITAIKGKIVDCNGNPVTSGKLQIGEVNNLKYIPINADGTFRYYLTCTEEKAATLKIQALSNGQVSAIINWQIVKNDINNVGNITICNNSGANYGYIEVDDDKFYFSQDFSFSATDKFSMSQVVTRQDTIVKNNMISISTKTSWVTFKMQYFLSNALNTANQIQNITLIEIPVTGSTPQPIEFINCYNCLNYTLTKFVANSEIEGSISGIYKGKTVKGNFRYKK